MLFAKGKTQTSYQRRVCFYFAICGFVDLSSGIADRFCFTGGCRVFQRAEEITFLVSIIAFCIFFGVSFVSYLLFFKIIKMDLSRGNLEDADNWFNLKLWGKYNSFKGVLIQCIMQIEAAFTGGIFINERYRGYFITFSNQNIGNLLFVFVIVMIVSCINSFIGFGLEMFLALEPLRIYTVVFFRFSSPSENGYLTYYAFALISLLMFYFLAGLIALVQLIWLIIKKISLTLKPFL